MKKYKLQLITNKHKNTARMRYLARKRKIKEMRFFFD
jgi:hypothetical protein